MWIVSRGGLITAVEVLVRHRSVEGGLHTKGRRGRQPRRSKIGQCKYVTQLQYSQSTGLIYNHSSNWQRWLAGGRRTGGQAVWLHPCAVHLFPIRSLAHVLHWR